jgi:hypothetical protein
MASDPAIGSRARTSRRLIVAVVLAGLVGGALWYVLRPRPSQTPHLLVGVDDDTLKWTANPLGVVRWQRRLGADAVRIWVPWNGEASPRGARLDELARAEEAATSTTVVLAVFGFAASSPITSHAQRRFCRYAKRVDELVPDARAIVVWNEANSAADSSCSTRRRRRTTR